MSARLRSRSLWSRGGRRPVRARRRWRRRRGSRARPAAPFGIAAWRLVQNSTVSRPGIGGIAAVLPLAITTARRATSCSPPTATVRRSVSVPSPRKSLAPVASIAAAGRLSSRLRAIHRTRVETLGKSTVHSTRDAASDASAIGLGQRFARAKQGLGRHAAPVRALAADELPLDNRQRQPAALKARGDRFSGDATAETDDVELLRQPADPRDATATHATKHARRGRIRPSDLGIGGGRLILRDGR